ncbi:hypothetical protein MYP_1833 [Sporocytophaga myxococcoides]|uniref:Uncharacterized protein n=1 Tax=Sporocytophaga myxococcoides TaxID=153721 RepID=A0A098LCB0_9BACT|nr:hypothetical protein [Sporocytophaga myxococcoides]GAL84605.1 hypothetical protein MYP_1833 [Sporocytophaga myxococcoides]
MQGLKKIKPEFPTEKLTFAIGFIILPIALIYSPYLTIDWSIISLLIFSIGVSLFFFWTIESTYMTIYEYPDYFKFIGYFSIRKIKMNEIEGYEIHQRDDRMDGFREEIILIIKGRENLILHKNAYKDYEEVKLLFTSRFRFISYSQLNPLIVKLSLVIGVLSGILAAFVGIMKLKGMI